MCVENRILVRSNSRFTEHFFRVLVMITHEICQISVMILFYILVWQGDLIALLSPSPLYCLHCIGYHLRQTVSRKRVRYCKVGIYLKHSCYICGQYS